MTGDDRLDRAAAAIKAERDDLALALRMELQDRRHGDASGFPGSKGKVDGLTRALELVDAERAELARVTELGAVFSRDDAELAEAVTRRWLADGAVVVDYVDELCRARAKSTGDLPMTKDDLEWND